MFVGGGVKLLHGETEHLKGYRNDVIDPIISQLNSREHVRHIYVAKDYTDLTRNVVIGKHQEVYNNYIVHNSHVALFIIDGGIGNITKQEIDIAVAATKKSSRPLVFIYGKDINEDDELLDYLNQKGIYFQHFYDNRDLAAKIKADLEVATNSVDRQRTVRLCLSIFLSAIFICFTYFMIRDNSDRQKQIVDSCISQLYLMRPYDVNALTGTHFFTNELISNFQYEDSIMTGNDINVFPIINRDTLATTTPPFFRLKIHNKHRSTIVFVEAQLEVDKYVVDSATNRTSFIPYDEIPDVNIVNIDEGKTEYLLKGFRHNVAYGETDDRYFFSIISEESCSFRMRVRAKTQFGEYLFSNYIYVNYVK